MPLSVVLETGPMADAMHFGEPIKEFEHRQSDWNKCTYSTMLRTYQRPKMAYARHALVVKSGWERSNCEDRYTRLADFTVSCYLIFRRLFNPDKMHKRPFFRRTDLLVQYNEARLLWWNTNKIFESSGHAEVERRDRYSKSTTSVTSENQDQPKCCFTRHFSPTRDAIFTALPTWWACAAQWV